MDSDRLVFDWQRPRGGSRRLWVAIGVAASLHVFWFYLFKVGTPPARRSIPPEESILWLDASDPASASVLRPAAWDSPVPGLPAAPAADDLEELGRVVPGYRPTWENHVASLQPRPQPAMDVPGLFAPPNEIFLPDRTRDEPPPLPSAPAAVRSVPVVVIQSGIAGRQMVTAPAWPQDVVDENWPEHGNAPFMIAVEPDGRVSSALPMNPTRGTVSETIRTGLIRMRFSPAAREAVDWGTVDVRW